VSVHGLQRREVIPIRTDVQLRTLIKPERYALEQLVLVDEVVQQDERPRVVVDTVLDVLEPLPPAA
jgi:hypothetical protein